MIRNDKLPNLQDFWFRRLRNSGVRRDAAFTVARRLNQQVKSMGLLGCIDYLKRVGDTLIWYLTKSGAKPPWVKTRGRFPIILDGLQDCSESVLLRIAKIARSMLLPDVHPRQVDKLVHGVESPSSASDGAINEVTKLVCLGMRSLNMYALGPSPGWERMPAVGHSFNKMQLTTGEAFQVSLPPLLDSIKLVQGTPQIRALPNWQDLFYPIHPWSLEKLVNPSNCRDDFPFVGEIHASQEGGGKLRMFASPYTVVQLALRPIHKFVEGYLKRLPTNCTYGQESGALWAMKKLSDGCVVHSIDLSTATCRFPLGPQVRVLEELGLPQAYIDLFCYVARGSWRIGKELVSKFKRKSFVWKVGQPLGIVPSMSLFSLTHNLVLVGLCERLFLDPEDSFRVLGDDVVISNDDLAEEYKKYILASGVPISWHKSHSSDRYAEFAGFSITPTMMCRPGQWRHVSFHNALAIATELGQPTYGEATKLIEEAQKAHLFRTGVISPPPEEWPALIRLATIVQDDPYVKPFKYGDTWYAGVTRYYTEQLKDPNIGFYPDRTEYFKHLARPILEFSKEHDLDWLVDASDGYFTRFRGLMEHAYTYYCERSRTQRLHSTEVLANTVDFFRSQLLVLWTHGRLEEGPLLELLEQLREGLDQVLFLPPFTNKWKAKSCALLRQYISAVQSVRDVANQAA